MRELGALVKLVNERLTPVEISDESLTIPSTGGYWGDYSVRLVELPNESDGVTIPCYTEVTILPLAETEFIVDYRTGIVTFHSTKAGQTVTASYFGRGSLYDAMDIDVLAMASNVHFYIGGMPSVTTAYNVAPDYGYIYKIPLGSAGGFFGTSDIGTIRVQGVSVAADIYTGVVIDDTEITVSNKAKGVSEAETIVCTLTHVGATTDRESHMAGSINIDTTSQYLYVFVSKSGGHSNINGWIWLRRTSL